MENLITQAAKLLKNGGVISLPTETVYSLSVKALDDAAVRSIYNLKGRPQNNPLSLFVGSVAAAREMVIFNKHAEILAEAFFPGAITLVLPLREHARLSEFINVGLKTLAVRMPQHQLTLDVLNNVDFPVVGTSANPSGMPPATSAAEVYEYFPGMVDMVLDGGSCDIGLASTIIDLSKDTPLILRQGSILVTQIEEKLGCRVANSIK
jgi:L-threonylcarbamoyladenylate synthase